AAVAGALGIYPVTANAEPTPAMSGLASALIPGLGQALQGDYGTGAAHFGVFATSLGVGYHYQKKPDFIDDDVRYADPDKETINQTTLRRDFALRLATDTALYSSFGAYRDAREKNNNSGYRTPAPKESLGDLALSPFRWEYLSRPTTFIPIGLQALAAF